MLFFLFYSLSVSLSHPMLVLMPCGTLKSLGIFTSHLLWLPPPSFHKRGESGRKLIVFFTLILFSDACLQEKQREDSDTYTDHSGLIPLVCFLLGKHKHLITPISCCLIFKQKNLEAVKGIQDSLLNYPNPHVTDEEIKLRPGRIKDSPFLSIIG